MKNNLYTALIFIISFLITLLSPMEADLSQIHYRNITLEELVHRSRNIFHTKKMTPFSTVEKIDITPAKGKKDDAEYPPFHKTTYHFKVIEVLRGKDRKGKEIDVLPAHTNSSLMLHKKYYIEGIGKSPVYEMYNTIADFEGSDELILFLYSSGGIFEFSAEEAYESVSQKKKIMKMIKKVL